MISRNICNMELLLIDFMKKNEQVVSNTPSLPDRQTRKLRYKLVTEEVAELLSAIDQNNMVKIADGIADSLVVIIGTAISYGIPVYDVFLEAHCANMSKNGPKNEYGKVTKGTGYKPPDFKKILQNFGWKNE